MLTPWCAIRTRKAYFDEGDAVNTEDEANDTKAPAKGGGRVKKAVSPKDGDATKPKKKAKQEPKQELKIKAEGMCLHPTVVLH